jgi:hypothetical protein
VSPEQQQREQLIERLADNAARLGIITPCLLLLEANRPLTYLAGQMVWATRPFITLGLNQKDVDGFARLLEDPSGVEQLIQRLESLQDARRSD